MSRREVLISALASASADLRRVARRASHAAAGPGHWALAEILSHLVHVESDSRARLLRVVSETRPKVSAIHPDESRHDPERSTGELLADFERAREETLAVLSSLKPGDWQRKAVFEDGRVVSLRNLVQMLVEHDTEHLHQASMLSDSGE